MSPKSAMTAAAGKRKMVKVKKKRKRADDDTEAVPSFVQEAVLVAAAAERAVYQKKRTKKMKNKRKKPTDPASAVASSALAPGPAPAPSHAQSAAAAAPAPTWPFATDKLDHCESPADSFADLLPCLRAMASQLSVQPWTQLWLFDPYYCDGASGAHLRALGFERVTHEKRDFYAWDPMPPFDVMVTNPPYSADHIPRCLNIAFRTGLPFCLLLPNWVAKQGWYADLVKEKAEAAGGGVFHVAPLQPYSYTMVREDNSQPYPDHVGADGKTTPYLSSWYCHVPSAGAHAEVLRAMEAAEKGKAKGKGGGGGKPPNWVVAKTVRGLKWKLQKKQQQRGDGGAYGGGGGGGSGKGPSFKGSLTDIARQKKGRPNRVSDIAPRLGYRVYQSDDEDDD